MSNVEDWERKHSLPPVMSGLLLVASLGMGFGFLFAGILQLKITNESKSWAHTDGVISQSRWREGRGSGSGSAQITYRYSVGGQSYEGSNILPGSNEYSEPDHRSKFRQYSTGTKVTVFYDPTDAQNSCLEVGVITRYPFIFIGLGIFFVFAAGGLAWRLLKGKPIVWVGHGTEPPPVIEDYHLFPKEK